MDEQTVVLSVVVPVFCEGEHLAESLRVIHGCALATHLPCEIIVVDDGSSDDTWDVLARVALEFPEVRVIGFSRNFGKEAAMYAGLQACRGQAAVILDGDLQHPPYLIPEMVRHWRDGGYKVVSAVKQRAGRASWISRIGATLFYRLFEYLAAVPLESSSDFKLLDREVIDAYLELPERRLFFRGLVAWFGFPEKQVPFDVARRAAGRSKWSLASLVRLAFHSLLSFSSGLLRVVTLCGVLFLGAALLVGSHALYALASGGELGPLTLVCLVQFLLGAIVMIALGIVGEYVARIHDELKGRPRFLISRRIGEPTAAQAYRIRSA
jgi:glycosyltransferase involved in cell wall biosynthesis